MSLPRRRLPSDVPERFNGVRVERDVPTPMRDGVLLRADVYRPTGPTAPSALPVVLIRLPGCARTLWARTVLGIHS